MAIPFRGSEALASGRLTPYQLRSRYAAVHKDVYLPRGAELSAVTRAHAAWLWSGREGVIAGQSAAALHRAKWVDDDRPAELLWPNRRPPVGVRTWSDRYTEDEVQLVSGLPATTPARTAFDIACRYPLGRAVAAIDALTRATHVKVADIELVAARYRGRRGIDAARRVLDLVDGGAESPRETWLRLLLLANGYPPPTTQIPVCDASGMLVAVLDMGLEDLKVGLDYDGSFHRDARRFDRDIRRHQAVSDLGWIDLRVASLDTEGGILARVAAAWSRRT
jgi:hypothetical protein